MTAGVLQLLLPIAALLSTNEENASEKYFIVQASSLRAEGAGAPTRSIIRRGIAAVAHFTVALLSCIVLVTRAEASDGIRWTECGRLKGNIIFLPENKMILLIGWLNDVWSSRCFGATLKCGGFTSSVAAAAASACCSAGTWGGESQSSVMNITKSPRLVYQLYKGKIKKLPHGIFNYWI